MTENQDYLSEAERQSEIYLHAGPESPQVACGSAESALSAPNAWRAHHRNVEGHA